MYEICVPDPRQCDFYTQADTLGRTSHTHMQQDRARTGAFVRAIHRVAKGKTVLEIGTGPDALLALEAAKAGAAVVYAVEANPASAAHARATITRAEAAGMVAVGQVVLIEKPSTELTLGDLDGGSRLVGEGGGGSSSGSCANSGGCGGRDGDVGGGGGGGGAVADTQRDSSASAGAEAGSKINLVIHELLGHLARSEGAALFFHDLRARGVLRPAPHCASIPHRAMSMICPGVAPSLEQLAKVPDRYSAVGPSEKYLVVGRAGALPLELLLSEPVPFEDLHFGDPDGIAPSVDSDGTTSHSFTISRAAEFGGIYLWLRFEADDTSGVDNSCAGGADSDNAGGVVDSYVGSNGQSTSWQITFVPLKRPAHVVIGEMVSVTTAVNARGTATSAIAGASSPTAAGRDRGPKLALEYTFGFGACGGRGGNPGGGEDKVTISLAELYPLSGGTWCLECGRVAVSDRERKLKWTTCRLCGGDFHRGCMRGRGVCVGCKDHKGKEDDIAA
jgi:hypothetical protein